MRKSEYSISHIVHFMGKYAQKSAAARIMKLNDRGILREGMRAGIVIFYESINVYRTIANGRTVYEQ